MLETSNFENSKASERRPRLAVNLVRVQKSKKGQYKITIPRGLARCLRLQAGDVLEVFIERGDFVFRIKERVIV